MRKQCNRDLFASWCALTAAGYDLAEPTGVTAELLEGIHTLPLDAQICAWFGRARTDNIRVNPWFPRASALSAGCFFPERALGSFLTFLRSTGTMDVDDAFVDWIAPYRAYIEAVKQSKGFAELWNRYREEMFNAQDEAVLKELEAKLLSFGYTIKEEVIFVPNGLQSPYLADYVLVGRQLFVICAMLNPLGIVHEYLHRALPEFQSTWLRIANTVETALLVNIEKMKAYGYILDDSPQSTAHALEDCFVRAVSALIVGGDLKAYAYNCQKDGFVFASALIEEAAFSAPQKDNLLPLVRRTINRLQIR